MKGIWIFGYGSLMWRPGFPFIETRRARLFGYHRAMCIQSVLYRGTEEKPGLVAGLMPGGSCAGLAFRVAPEVKDEVIDYLDARELIGDVYIPGWRTVHFDGGRVQAYCYVANRANPQYAGRLDPERAARIIWDAHGSEGAGREYVENILAHLDELGIRDGALRRLAAWFPKLDEANPG